MDFDKLSVDEQRKLFKKKSDTAKKVQRQLAMTQESLQDVTGSLRNVTGSNRDMSSTIRSQQDLQGTMVAQSREERQEANRRREEDRLRYEAQNREERQEANRCAERLQAKLSCARGATGCTLCFLVAMAPMHKAFGAVGCVM